MAAALAGESNVNINPLSSADCSYPPPASTTPDERRLAHRLVDQLCSENIPVIVTNPSHRHPEQRLVDHLSRSNRFACSGHTQARKTKMFVIRCIECSQPC